MKKNQIIKNVLFLPTAFYANKNASTYSILKESGYFNEHNEIQEYDLLKALLEYPECIQNWLLLSADKRTDSGWYFNMNEDRKYIVGYSPARGNLKLTEYADINEACAAFIKREIEDIRTN